jgi:hypothetical protein
MFLAIVVSGLFLKFDLLVIGQTPVGQNLLTLKNAIKASKVRSVSGQFRTLHWCAYTCVAGLPDGLFSNQKSQFG